MKIGTCDGDFEVNPAALACHVSDGSTRPPRAPGCVHTAICFPTCACRRIADGPAVSAAKGPSSIIISIPRKAPSVKRRCPSEPPVGCSFSLWARFVFRPSFQPEAGRSLRRRPMVERSHDYGTARVARPDTSRVAHPGRRPMRSACRNGPCDAINWRAASTWSQTFQSSTPCTCPPWR